MTRIQFLRCGAGCAVYEETTMAKAYLLKTEPTEYSFEDLKKDGVTEWDGVSNPVALKNLRGMEPGDRLIIYETADRKAAEEVSDAGRNQSQKIVRGFSVGAHRKTVGSSADGSTVRSADRRVNLSGRHALERL